MRHRTFLGAVGLATFVGAIGACGSNNAKSTSGSTGSPSGSGAATSSVTSSVGPSGSGGATSGPSTSGAGGSTVDAGPIVAPQPLSPYIVVDQFGYRTTAEKIAVMRSPKVGFDATTSFTPGASYELVDAHSSATVTNGAPAVWNGGATDTSSGDIAWSFDFSSVTTAGDYFVLDVTNAVRSDVFSIGDGVYAPVLNQALRMYYYQRDGIAKDAKFAGADWADGIEHPQDATCGLYSDGTTPRDLHGGWWDAGDQNKYTNWAASDVIVLMHAYLENPSAFGDDQNIPESGNGVPDVLDEIKWEVDWLTRMQGSDGSLLSIVGHTGASPPSMDTAPCKYGSANTSGTLTSAAAFAYASKVFSTGAAAKVYPGYAATLKTAAQNAWTWALANPDVTFYNAQNNIGAGEQEVDDTGRLWKKVQAAVYLFELTGDTTYQQVVDANYTQLEQFDVWHLEELDTLLEYTKVTSATASVVSSILGGYKSLMEGGDYAGSLASNADPYGSYMDPMYYVWGSNQIKGAHGNAYENMSLYAIDPSMSAVMAKYAERFVHYFHGVNPLQMTYLSNMEAYGASKSPTRFFHSWFANGSDWDAFGVSKYGPPSGYLTGGANPSYNWDGCCPSGCGSSANNALCGSAAPSPPAGQPNQKAYKDFNNSWPLDSWQVTEPDLGYQAQYVRLVSKFVH